MLNYPLFLLNPPTRLAVLGQGLAWLGCFILSVAAVGQASLRMIAVVQHRVPGAAPPSDLAAFWTGLPAWWIPETVIGALPAVAFVALGRTLASDARRLRRLYF